MKLLILFISMVVFIACQTSQVSSENKAKEDIYKQMQAEQEMVKSKIAQDLKSDEQIFEELLAEERSAVADEGGENVETFQCCAHWMADGTCAHELIPGCSQELDADNGVQSLFLEVRAPDSCCASYSATGQCLHEIIPGCASR